MESIDSETDSLLENYPDLSVQEIEHIVMAEDVVHIDDFILRRSMVGKLGYVTPEGLEEIGAVLARSLGWDDGQCQIEINRVIDLLQTKHRMNFNQFIEGVSN